MVSSRRRCPRMRKGEPSVPRPASTRRGESDTSTGLQVERPPREPKQAQWSLRSNRIHRPMRGKSLSIMAVIMVTMATSDSFSSIPVHRSTIRALQSVKTADQTWDDFLMALADDYISPSLQRELDRRLRSEEIVSGASMKREFAEWRRRRGEGSPRR